METIYDHVRKVRHRSVMRDEAGYPITCCGTDLRGGGGMRTNWCSYDEEIEGVIGEWCPKRYRHETLPKCVGCDWPD